MAPNHFVCPARRPWLWLFKCSKLESSATLGQRVWSVPSMHKKNIGTRAPEKNHWLRDETRWDITTSMLHGRPTCLVHCVEPLLGWDPKHLVRGFTVKYRGSRLQTSTITKDLSWCSPNCPKACDTLLMDWFGMYCARWPVCTKLP